MTNYPNFFEQTARDVFADLLPRFNPQRILQLGVFTGDATVWLCDNIAPSLLVDVDTWDGGGIEQWAKQYDWADVEAVYKERTSGYDNLRSIKSTTRDYLAEALLEGAWFDMVYIDADHTTAATLESAVMAYPLLSVGGLMVFDDYVWENGSGHLLDDPGPAINAFRYLYLDRMNFVALGSQFWLQKMR